MIFLCVVMSAALRSWGSRRLILSSDLPPRRRTTGLERGAEIGNPALLTRAGAKLPFGSRLDASADRGNGDADFRTQTEHTRACPAHRARQVGAAVVGDLPQCEAGQTATDRAVQLRA